MKGGMRKMRKKGKKKNTEQKWHQPPNQPHPRTYHTHTQPLPPTPSPPRTDNENEADRSNESNARDHRVSKVFRQ